MRRVVMVTAVIAIFFFFSSDMTMQARGNEVTEFYTYCKRENRILNDHERIETFIYGTCNFNNIPSPKEDSGYGLPRLTFEDIDSGKLLGVWLNGERLDAKYYFISSKDRHFEFKFDIEDEAKKAELEQKFKELDDFEITIPVYIKKQQEFYKEQAQHIFNAYYESSYDKNDIYHKYSIILPYPSEHNLKATAIMQFGIEMEGGKWEPQLNIEIKDGDLTLTWLITFPDKQDLFEKVIGEVPHLVYVTDEKEEPEQQKIGFTIKAVYSYESLPLLQLLCALIVSFFIGFTIQFFEDVKEGGYNEKDRLIGKIKFFGIKNWRIKIRYTFFSFIVLGALILLLFAPDVFNTEAIRIFYIKLSSLHLFSIESATYIQGISIWIITVFIILGFYLVLDFQTRQDYMDKVEGKIQTLLRMFSPNIFVAMITIIILLFTYANGLFQSAFIAQLFVIEMGIEMYICLGLVAYLKLYWVSISSTSKRERKSSISDSFYR